MKNRVCLLAFVLFVCLHSLYAYPAKAAVENILCSEYASRIISEAKLINVARISSNKVSASSVNGNRVVSNPYYGALNLFDDEKERYSSWLSNPVVMGNPEWVKIEFPSRPTVYGVEILPDTDFVLRDASIVVTIRDAKGVKTEKSFHNIVTANKPTYCQYDGEESMKGEKGLVTVFYFFDAPIRDVEAVFFKFPIGTTANTEIIHLKEIRVFGSLQTAKFEIGIPVPVFGYQDALSVANDALALFLSKKYGDPNIVEKDYGWEITYKDSVNLAPTLIIKLDHNGRAIEVKEQ